MPAHAQIDVTVSAPIAPPLLPIYAQPPIPGPGYLWVPGYWAWDGTEYYWVPGYWEQPPTIGYYWTPSYWAWDNADNDYVFYAGYWGPTVGYYGGIDYGFGYTGEGYHGGYWRNDQFYYNRGVNNLEQLMSPASSIRSRRPQVTSASTAAMAARPSGQLRLSWRWRAGAGWVRWPSRSVTRRRRAG